MNWETIITATVVAAFISGVYSIIKSLVDNNAKRNDAIALFKYTKLYEILSTWYTQNDLIIVNLNNPISLESDRIKNLQISYALAKPLLDAKYYADFQKGFDEISRLKIEYLNNLNTLSNTRKNEIEINLIHANGKLEKLFELIVQDELKALLEK